MFLFSFGQHLVEEEVPWCASHAAFLSPIRQRRIVRCEYFSKLCNRSFLCRGRGFVGARYLITHPNVSRTFVHVSFERISHFMSSWHWPPRRKENFEVIFFPIGFCHLVLENALFQSQASAVETGSSRWKRFFHLSWKRKQTTTKNHQLSFSSSCCPKPLLINEE